MATMKVSINNYKRQRKKEERISWPYSDQLSLDVRIFRKPLAEDVRVNRVTFKLRNRS